MQRNLSRCQLATLLGTDFETVQAWEAGEAEPDAEYWLEIVKFLGYIPERAAPSIGEKILGYREANGLARASLAERMGVSEEAIAGWEKGRYQPSRASMKKIERALGGGAAGM